MSTEETLDPAWAEYEKVTASALAAGLRATLNRTEVTS